MSPGEVSVDEAVDRLTRQARWAGPGLWLAWVFTESDAAVRALRAALDASTSVRFDLVDERTALVALEGLFALDPSVHTAWIVATTPDAATRDGWTTLHLRLNERREALERAFGGGVVFAGGTWLKSASRDAAPDLWSVRTQVLDVASPGATPVVTSVAGIPTYWRGTSGDARSRAASWFEEWKATGAPATGFAVQMATALLRGGHLADAFELAQVVLRDASHPSQRARGHALLGAVLQATGDLAGSLQSYDAALGAPPSAVDSLRWRLERTQVLGRLGRTEEALQEAQAVTRALESQGSVNAWAGLAAVAECLGALGRTADAEANFELALSAASRPGSDADPMTRAFLTARLGGLRRTHDPEAGFALISSAIELYRQQLSVPDRHPGLRFAMADALMERAHALRLAGRRDEERSDLMEALGYVDAQIDAPNALNAARLHAMIAASDAPDADEHRRYASQFLDDHPRETLEPTLRKVHDQIRSNLTSGE